jgi:hypothetical protein
MKKLMLAAIPAAFISGAFAEEVPITGNVESKCVITTDTSGVYGNPAPDELTTRLADGGVPAIVRYDVIAADYYKAIISYPNEFTTSPSLNDTVSWEGDVTVDQVSDTQMSGYDTNKIEYNNSTEYELEFAGSTWFKVGSTAEYGVGKSFPGGQYRSVVTAECIAQ